MFSALRNRANRGGECSTLTAIEYTDDWLDPAKGTISKHLVSRNLNPKEQVRCIKKLLADKEEQLGAKNLGLDDASTFVELVDEVLRAGRLDEKYRPQCVHYLARVCGWHGVLPNSVRISNHQLDSQHSSGGHSTVWIGKHNGREVIIKVLKFFASYEGEKKKSITRAFCQEVVIWRHLDHPNIVPFIGADMVTERGREKYHIVSELMGKGTIEQFLELNQGVNKLELLKDVAAGLSYLHSQEVVHGDLKGENILINEHGRACLVDFGISRVLAEFSSSGPSNPGGTTEYMSPELLWPEKFEFENSKPTKGSDVYALGVVIYEIICGHRLHQELASRVVAGELDQEHPPSRPDVGFTDPLWETLEGCLRLRREMRPSAHDVLGVLDEASRA